MRRISPSYRISAITMAFLMFISSTGIAMDIHYCQSTMEGISLVGEAQTCHEKDQKLERKACHQKKKVSHCQKDAEKEANEGCEDNCCSKEMIYSHLDTDFLTSQQSQIDKVVPQSLLLPVPLVIGNPQGDELPVKHYLEYKPPQVPEDIPVLIQAFLI